MVDCEANLARAVKAKPLPCSGPNCRSTRPPWRFFCDSCWKALPGWLRVAIAKEKKTCRAVHTAHTQQLLTLRDMACDELQKLLAKRREAS